MTAWSKRAGHRVVSVFEGQGISDAKCRDQRPGFKAVLKAAMLPTRAAPQRPPARRKSADGPSRQVAAVVAGRDIDIDLDVAALLDDRGARGVAVAAEPN